MLRTLRRHFGISAPRLAVRTHVAWPLRVVWGLLLGGAVVAMIWWGFDAGRLFAGFDRSEAEQTRARLQEQVQALQEENTGLRSRMVQLESELGVAKGAQAVLSSQALAMQRENTQIKEDLVFLQKLFAGSGKELALSVQRLQVDRVSPGEFRLRMLVVQGGRKNEEFSGFAQIVVYGLDSLPVLTLPETETEARAPFKLAFKYYQRVEASIRVPPDVTVKSVQARVYEAGNPNPRATQTQTW
ncbi:hypothetical protein BURK2_02674 [Burkholderiales bacterium]|nr:hypothetical protein BURK2_02674 [Burkholderiales bacterium]